MVFGQPVKLINKYYLLSIYILCLGIICGFDAYSHFVYNLRYLLDEKQGSTSLYSLLTGFHSFKYLYLNIVAPYLTNAWLFLGLSICIKALLVLMVYLTVRQMLNEHLSLLVVILLTFSGSNVAHGMIANGMWGPAVFMPASLSALFSLLFLFYWLQGKYIIGFIMAGLAVQFHALYGIGAMVFAFIGMIYTIVSSNEIQDVIKQNLIGVIVFLSFIIYALITDYSSLKLLVVSGVTIQNWYQFARLVDSDNMSINFSIIRYGYGFTTLIVAGAFYSLRRKEKLNFDYLTLGAFITLVVCIIIELLHNNGIFIGKFSELFIGLQLRRGVWVAVLFSLISIASEFETKDSLKHFDYLVSAFIVAMCFPTIAVFTCSMFLFSILRISDDRYAVIVIGAAYILFAALAISAGNIDLSREMKSLVPFIVVLGALYTIKHIPTPIPVNVVYMSVVICLLLSLTYSLKINRFTDSATLLTNIDFTDRHGIRSYMAKIGSDYKTVIYDQSLMRFLESKEVSEKGSVIQMPLATSEYNSEVYYNSPFIVNTKTSFMFSKLFFTQWIGNLSFFWNKSDLLSFIESGNYNMKSFLKEFDSHFESADRNILKRAKTKKKLRFYIISKMRDELADLFVYKSDHYYVYDLGKLQ